MVKKRPGNSYKKKSSSFTFQKLERGFERDVVHAEKWIIARRKFFIKLGWLVFLLTLLFIFSHLFLRIRGLGV